MATQTPNEVTLANLAGGGLMETFNSELRKVCENISDPNTKANAKRKLQITLVLEPDEKRDTVRITYDTKLSMPGPDAGKTLAYIARSTNSKKLTLIEVETHQPLFEETQTPFVPLADAKRA